MQFNLGEVFLEMSWGNMVSGGNVFAFGTPMESWNIKKNERKKNRNGDKEKAMNK